MNWLTAWRLRVYPTALAVGLLLGFVLFVATATGPVARWVRVGGDFPPFYAAAAAIHGGEADLLYDLDRQRFHQAGEHF